MLISVEWLKRYVDITESPQELADLLTMLGLEAEDQKTIQYSPLIVTARVLKVNDHPNADKLKICLVNDGEDDHKIICGAPNVAENQLVVLAKIGSMLPGNIKIKAARIRGEKSAGMICSERELGLSDEHEGIIELPFDTPVGIQFSEYIKKKLDTLDLDITPNRPDALSHIGIAREIALKTGRKLNLPEIHTDYPDSTNTEKIKVIIDDSDGCPRYVAGVVDNIKVGPAPDWMITLLESAGQRSINNIVDISNFVLLELGQPTHIFDFKLLPTNTIQVRKAKKDEKFITLDNLEHKLNDQHLLITDGNKSVALAGIMGGLNTAVTEETKTVLIESAYFDPVTIRKGSKSLGMLTEASRRFERGSDPEATVTAFWRIVGLLREYANGKLVSKMVDAYPKNISTPEIKLRNEKLEMISGFMIEAKQIEEILTGLNIDWKKKSDGSWVCRPPSFRPDLEREIDLIEEIIRFYGYDSVPINNSFTGVFDDSVTDPHQNFNQIHSILGGLGFQQCFNNTLQPENEAKSIGKNPVVIINPLSEQLSNIRTSLLPGLLQNIDYNIKVGNPDLMLYELGQVHEQVKDGFSGIQETSLVTGIIHGNSKTVSIYEKSNAQHSFYSVKGIIESLAEKLFHQKPVFEAVNSVEFIDSFKIAVNGTNIGVFGEIDSNYIDLLKIESGQIFGFTMNIDEILKLLENPVQYQPPSIYPKITRDLNFVLDSAISAGAVIGTIRNIDQKLIKSVQPVDIYQDESLGNEKKSILFQIVFQDDSKTLEDKHVYPIINEIINNIESQFNAKLRK